MEIRFTCLALSAALLVPLVSPAEPSRPPKESAATDSAAIALGLWRLTAQPQAMTLSHVLKELHLDQSDYKVEGGPWYYNLVAVDSVGCQLPI